MRPQFWILGCCAAALLCGCKPLEYQLREPAAHAGRLSRTPLTWSQPPLEYRLTSGPGRVVVRVGNPQDVAVALVATQSYVIDSEGESHPIQGGVIGPHSHLRLELPPRPVRLTSYVDGFYTGLDWPLGPYGYPYWPGYGWPVWGPALTTRTYDLSTPYNWNWRRGEIRVHLGYSCAGTNFAHEFSLNRERVK